MVFRFADKEFRTKKEMLKYVYDCRNTYLNQKVNVFFGWFLSFFLSIVLGVVTGSWLIYFFVLFGIPFIFSRKRQVNIITIHLI